MNVTETLTHVAIATLAVIGLYGIFHGVLEAILRPRQLTAAVVIRTMDDAADLDILLCEARRSPCRQRGRGVVLAIDRGLLDGRMGTENALKEEYALLAERYGAEICVLWTE